MSDAIRSMIANSALPPSESAKTMTISQTSSRLVRLDRTELFLHLSHVRTLAAAQICAGRRVAQEHGGRWPLPRRRDSHLSPALPAENGLVLDQQIVEFAPLHAFDESGDLSPGVDEGGAFRVA